MRAPSFKELAEDTQAIGFHSMFYGTRMHPNPRIYKYFWWVFWRGSHCEGSRFLKTKFGLSTKQAFELIAQLELQQESHWIYNTRQPRRDPSNPFDPKSRRWKGASWAPSFDEDKDELFDGFK